MGQILKVGFGVCEHQDKYQISFQKAIEKTNVQCISAS
jgi:hypothetical protein